MLNSLQIRIEELEKIKISKRVKHLKFLENYGIQFLGPRKLKYVPSLSGITFHESTKNLKHIMGPVNSGKSTICCMDILHQMSRLPRCTDGIRRGRFVVMRNTTPQLYTSIFKTWTYWFEELGTMKISKKPILEINHQYNDGNGPLMLTVMFLACDRDDDLYKLKSTEFSGAYLNELSEFGNKTLSFLAGRVGRYPSSQFLEKDKDGHSPPIPSVIITDTNPPDTDHWVYKLFEESENSDNFLFIKQPPGLIKENGKWKRNEQADNFNYINEDYYLNIARTATKEFIKVFCLGEYGFVETGKFVYEQYHDDIHAVDNIPITKNEPVYFGWDFGLNPAFICCQLIQGQLRVIKEFHAQYCSVREFVENLVLPWINIHLRNHIFYSDCDPSDKGSDADNITCISVLNELGIPTQKALTNNIIERIDSVKHLLSRLTYGKPGLIINKRECPVLRKGFLGEYKFKRVNILSEERYCEVPDKKHPVSDIHDCLQYISLRIQSTLKPLPSVDNNMFMDYSKFM